MNQKALDIITAEIRPVLEDKNFKKQTANGIEFYSNGERAISIIFDEKKDLFILRQAEVKEDSDIVWLELAHWLFDSESESDARSIGRDFNDTIKSALGVKAKGRSTADVAIPSKEVSGDHMKMDAFVGKFLVVYPQFKDAYKENVTNNGEFLYDDFFNKTAVPTLKEVLKAGNKKQCEKIIGLLNDSYLNGDTAVVTTVTYTILAGTFIDEPHLWEVAENYMDKSQYLKTSGKAMLDLLKNDKVKSKYLFI